MALQTKNERERRARLREQREQARASRLSPDFSAQDASASLTVWRYDQLPEPRTAAVGVPLSEGVSSVLIGSIAYIPIALVTGYAWWNYVVSALLVIALSYALLTRRVVAGPSFVAVRKFGAYRVATAQSIALGALTNSQRGGVLKLRTGDGRTMRLRRVEFSHPEVSATLRGFLLASGRPYDELVMQRLDLPFNADFGHHRYLLDAID